MLTNAALDPADAPDHDLSNPRTGWRYALDYELLDSRRNVITKSRYHFRSQIRQLIEKESGQSIYPIFFGKNSKVAAQTRVMQLAINRDEKRAAILRVKVASADDEIHELVARVFARCERENYDSRTTWNRLSQPKRESICKHCVYHHDLLTIEERNNLLRWQWRSAPILTEFENRYLFFIGDIDDQEVRADQIPAGLYADQNWRGIVALPDEPGRVRLEFQHVDPVSDTTPAWIDLNWFGTDTKQRKSHHHESVSVTSQASMKVHGGMLELLPSARVVTNVFWQPIGAADSDDAIERDITPAQESRPVQNVSLGNHQLLQQDHTDREPTTGPATESTTQQVEPNQDITPAPAYVRTFLADSRPFEYAISHSDGKPTPLRIALRYPYAPLFSNLGDSISPDESGLPIAAVGEATWEFIGTDGEIVDTGTLRFEPTKSIYDRFTVASKLEPVSDPKNYYFAVPPEVEKVRVRSDDCRLLVATYTRVAEMPRVIQVPEDYHAFNRKDSTRRTWFGLNPLEHEDMVQSNRSFIIQSQSRPPETNEQILVGDYNWQSYAPKGQWIGRQMLIPQATEVESAIELEHTTGVSVAANQVRESAIGITFAELEPLRQHNYRSHASEVFADQTKCQIVFCGKDSPEQITVLVNGVIVHKKRMLSARGRINLDHVNFGEEGTIEVRSENPTRFFFSGKDAIDTDRFIKRTAQRLRDGQLVFEYQKNSAEGELLTLQLYRGESELERCQLQVVIEGPFDSMGNVVSNAYVTTRESQEWTVRRRRYDLKAQSDHGSVLLGSPESVDTGHRCFIKMGADLPPGNYKIHVERADDVADGYVLLYQATPGKQQTRTIRMTSVGVRSDG